LAEKEKEQQRVTLVKCGVGFRSSSSSSSPPVSGILLAHVPLSFPKLLEEGLNSQALVNHQEGGAAILACLAQFLSVVANAKAAQDQDARGQEGKLRLRQVRYTLSSYENALVWHALGLCKQILRYHVRSLFFFVKSGSAAKQANVMRVFQNMCRLGDWTALDMLKRVDWHKFVNKCRGFAAERNARGKQSRGPSSNTIQKEEDSLTEAEEEEETQNSSGTDSESETPEERPKKKRRKTTVQQQPTAENVAAVSDMDDDEEDYYSEDERGMSPRQAYVSFAMSLVELDHKDVWDYFSSFPILLKTLLVGLQSDWNKGKVYRVLQGLKTHLFEGRHWCNLSMQKRHKLIQHQHLRLLCLAMSPMAFGGDGSNSKRVQTVASEILTNLCTRNHKWSLFPIGDKDFLALFLASHLEEEETAATSSSSSHHPFSSSSNIAKKLDSVTTLCSASSENTITAKALKDYAITLNKSMKYSKKLNHGKWFYDLQPRDPLFCAFLFTHWRPSTSHQSSAIQLASTGGSLVEWISKVSLIVYMTAGLRHVCTSMKTNFFLNVKHGGCLFSSTEPVDPLFDLCISTFVLPSVVVEKNAIVASLQSAVLHNNLLAAHKVLQLCELTLENCLAFVASFQGKASIDPARGEEDRVYANCITSLKSEVQKVLPDMKFLMAIHMHFRDQMDKKRKEEKDKDKDDDDDDKSSSSHLVQELVLLQSLRCLKSLGKLYTIFGLKWAHEASKCISESLLNSSVRHKTELLEFLLQAAESEGDATLSSSWKALSLIFHVLLEKTHSREPLCYLAEKVIIKLLMNTHLFEAYPAEIGVWLGKIKCAASVKQAEEPATSVSILVDFFCQAVYQTIGKVTDLVYFLQDVCTKKNNGEESKMNSEIFGPLVLTTTQQCCSFLSSQKRSPIEKAVVAEFVCSVARDLISLNTSSNLLQASLLEILEGTDCWKDSKAPSTPHVDEMAALHSLCKQTGGENERWNASQLAQHADSSLIGQSADAFSLFNYLTRASQLVASSKCDFQASAMNSLLNMLDQGDLRVPKIVPYSDARWFRVLASYIDGTLNAIQEDPQSHLLLTVQMTVFMEKLITLSGLQSSEVSLHYRKIMERIFSHLLQTFYSCKGEYGKFHMTIFHLLLRVLKSTLRMGRPSESLILLLYGLQSHTACGEKDSKSVQNTKVEYQMCLLKLCVDQSSSHTTNSDLQNWWQTLMASMVRTSSEGLVCVSSALQKKHLTPYFECFVGKEKKGKVRHPLACYISSDFIFKYLLRKMEKDKCEFLNHILETNKAAMGLFASFVTPAWIETLDGAVLAAICPTLVRYFSFAVEFGKCSLSSSKKSSDAKEFQNHARTAKLCFELAASHLFEMTLDLDMSVLIGSLVGSLLQNAESFQIDLVKYVRKLKKRGKKGKKKNPMIGKDQMSRFSIPLLRAVCAFIDKLPSEALGDFRSFLLSYFKENGVYHSIVNHAKFGNASPSFLRNALKVVGFLLDEIDAASDQVEPMARDFMPIFIRKALSNQDMLDRMLSFTSKVKHLLISEMLPEEEAVTAGKERRGGNWCVQLSSEMVDLIVSHSAFREVLFGIKEARANERKAYVKSILSNKSSVNKTGKWKLLGLRREKTFCILRNLIEIGNHHFLYESEEGRRQCQQLHSMLLSAYSCCAEQGDSGLLQLMGVLSKDTSLTDFAKFHYLWGEAFRRYSLCAMDDANQRDALKAIVLNVQLPSISVDSVVSTIHYVLGMGGESPGNVYNPWFMLHFIKHHMYSGTIDHEAAICKGLLSFNLACLCSKDAGLRKVAHETFIVFCSASASFDFKDSDNIGSLLRKTKLMIPDADDRVAAPTIVLVAEFVLSLMFEESLMHSNAKKLLGRDSTFDTSNIPVFLDLLHNCSPDYLKYQRWLLSFLQLSLAEDGDFPPFRKRFAFEVLMGFASASFSRPEMLMEILLLLKKACTLEKFTYELLYKRNILSWLSGLMQSNEQVRRPKGDLLQMAMATLLQIVETANRCQWQIGASACNGVATLLSGLVHLVQGDASATKLLCRILIELTRASGGDVEILTLGQWRSMLRVISKGEGVGVGGCDIDAEGLEICVLLTCLVQGRNIHFQEQLTQDVLALNLDMLERLDVFKPAAANFASTGNVAVCSCFLLYLAFLSMKGMTLSNAQDQDTCSKICLLVQRSYSVGISDSRMANLVVLKMLADSTGHSFEEDVGGVPKAVERAFLGRMSLLAYSYFSQSKKRYQHDWVDSGFGSSKSAVAEGDALSLHLQPVATGVLDNSQVPSKLIKTMLEQLLGFEK
jgi:hypothetical protein